MKNYIIFVFSLVLLLLFYSGKTSQMLNITFCDVGQGDATVLSIGHTQMLIDAGPNSKVLECLELHMPFWDKTIEYFVLTHMDADHIGGAADVLDFYKINFVFMNPSQKKTSDFSHLEQALLRKKAEKTMVLGTYLGQKVRISDGFWAKVISPNIDFSQVNGDNFSSSETTLSDVFLKKELEKSTKMSENDLSIALKVTFGDVSIVLPGDLEKKGELAILRRGLLNKVDLLKAGHHGSKSSSTPGFIEVLQPEITVISSGKNNAYNHPSPQVITTFDKFGVPIYQTKNSGELNFVSDGTRFWETDSL